VGQRVTTSLGDAVALPISKKPLKDLADVLQLKDA
jgi:hypothetical protein